MLSTIFVFEFKKIKNSTIFWALNFFFFTSAIYALQNGKNIIYQQNKAISKALLKEDSVFKSIVYQIQHPDTLTEDGKWNYSHLNDASWLISSPNKRWTSYWQPSHTSFIALGNRDVYPYYHELEPFSFYMRFFKTEISSPFKLLFGNFDLSFVITLLFPLYIIALTFDVYSSEVEGKTDPILQSIVNVKKYLFKKLLFYGFVSFLILNLILVLACFFDSEIDWVIWGKIFLLSNIYLLIWLVFSYILYQFKLSSVQNAIVFLGWWVLLAIGLPATFNTIANYKYPINAEIFSKYIRRAQIKDDRATLSNTLEKFGKYYPQYNQTDTSDNLLFGKSYVAVGAFNDIDGDKALQIYFQQILKQENFLNTFNYINPVSHTQQIFNLISQTDIADYMTYTKNARDYLQVIKEDLTHKYFTNQKIKIEDLQKRLSFSDFLKNKSKAK